MLDDAAGRGLIHVDAGASGVAPGQIAGAQNIPFAKSDVVIDAMPSGQEIDHALARLELVRATTAARSAPRMRSRRVLARIAAWSRQVESRGFVLVPIRWWRKGRSRCDARPEASSEQKTAIACVFAIR